MRSGAVSKGFDMGSRSVALNTKDVHRSNNRNLGLLCRVVLAEMTAAVQSTTLSEIHGQKANAAHKQEDGSTSVV